MTDFGDDAAPGLVDARYRSLFFDHPHAVFSLDLDGCFVEANPATGRLTGYAPGAMLGMPIAAVVEPSDLKRAREAFLGAVKRQPQSLELVIRRADGRLTDVKITGLPLVIDDQVQGVYGIAEDVTDRNRTARDLNATRQVAALASEEKSDFLARASHEIRTPLTGILAAAELLEQTEPTADQQPLLATLLRSTKRLMTLVDNVLKLSTIGAAREARITEDFDFHAMVHDAVDLADVSARHKGLRVDLDIAPGVPRRVRDHPTWTSQVLGNLLSNAVNYTETGQVSLSVSATTGLNGGESVILRVKDTGVGIEPAEQDRIWEPFARVSSARSVPGSGVGLAVVKQLVAISGGSIALDSAPGRGSTFTVVLPITSLPDAPP